MDFKNLRFTRTSEESKALNLDPKPKVIISASGMCEAGRIKHHLKHNLWNPKASIIFVGYQSVGTLGRSIVDGDKTVTIFGERIQVEAEIHNFQGFRTADKMVFEWVEVSKTASRDLSCMVKKALKDSWPKLFGRFTVIRA